MALLDEINERLRDFVGWSSSNPLPIGDPRTGVYNPSKADFRELLKTIAQSIGDPDALDEIINRSFMRRRPVAAGTSLATLTAPGVYELPANGAYPQFPEGADATALHWLIVSDAGHATSAGGGRFVLQQLVGNRLADYNTPTARHAHFERRLDTQNPTVTRGNNIWVRMDGSTAGRVLFQAATHAEQVAALGLDHAMKPYPPLAAGSHLSDANRMGTWVLMQNGGYGGWPAEADPTMAWVLTVTPTGLQDGTLGRFMIQRMESLTLRTVDGIQVRDVFSRRLDQLNPTVFGGNGAWVWEHGRPTPVDPAPVASESKPELFLPYVQSGALRVVDANGDRVLNDDDTWISAQASNGAALAVREADGVRSLVAVAPDTGNIFGAGATELRLGAGQSNGRGSQQGAATYQIEPWPNQHGSRLRMPGGNVWGGIGVSGTQAFDPSSIDSLQVYQQAIYGNSGPSSVEAAALRYADRALASGMKLSQIVANIAVGSSTIADLENDPPVVGNTRWDNAIALLERIAALAPGEKIRCRWLSMHQGEGNRQSADLGALHDGYRAKLQAEIQRIFGQVGPVRMVTWQPASYSVHLDGVHSLLDYHIANSTPGGSYWLGGPSYEFPFVNEYLHHSALGHMMRGEMEDEIIRRVDRFGSYTPLHMVSAQRTGANEIRVTLSHPATIDTTNPRVAPIANTGITLAGGTVASVGVSGNILTVVTTGAASSVTAVMSAAEGQGSPRTAARIPRTNVRGTEILGRFRASNQAMFRWLCAQSLPVTP